MDLEQVESASGIPKQSSETPREYLNRVSDLNDVPDRLRENAISAAERSLFSGADEQTTLPPEFLSHLDTSNAPGDDDAGENRKESTAGEESTTVQEPSTAPSTDPTPERTVSLPADNGNESSITESWSELIDRAPRRTIPALVVTILVGISGSYLWFIGESATPALYMAMARQIQSAGYALPVRIEHYTAGGLPMAYPPLGFYVWAVLNDLLGISFYQLDLWTRLVYYPIAGGIFYKLSEELTGDRTTAAVSTVLAFSSLATFRWHLEHGGGIRTLGYIWMFAAIYTAVRYYRSESWKWAAATAVCFGGAVLTHPQYAPMAGLGVLTVYLSEDRSPAGLLAGAGIAVGGFVLSAPYYVTVISHHGIEPYLWAAGTHGGLFQIISNLNRVLNPMKYSSVGLFTTMVMYGSLLGLPAVIQDRNWTLAALPAMMIVVNGIKFRFIMPFLALLFAVGLFRVVLPELIDEFRLPDLGLSEIAAVAVVVVAITTGVPQMGSLNEKAWNADHEAAAEWIQGNTDPDATFYIIDRNEEIPYYAERTGLAVPWGAEWDGPGAYERNLRIHGEMWDCRMASCYDSVLKKYSLRPDYVYTYAGSVNQSSFESSRLFSQVYNENGIVIYRHSKSGEGSNG